MTLRDLPRLHPQPNRKRVRQRLLLPLARRLHLQRPTAKTRQLPRTQNKKEKQQVTEIPPTLIKYLAPLGPHFCLVKANGKDPSVGGKGWQKTPLRHDDPKLQEHLKRGGNYGVVGGWGLVIIDIDSPELKQAAKKLPLTFTVESPGSHGWHLYYLCSLHKPIRLRDSNHENIGDIQGQGKQVVGPGSRHPNGGTYKIIKPYPLAQITPEQIQETFKDYIVPEKEIEQAHNNAREHSQYSFPITKIIDTTKLYTQGDEYQGAHPIHGSKTGRNFSVNPEKNVWHCWRHSTGGGPLLWLAVKDGIIRCEEATSGALKGIKFRQVLDTAVKQQLIKPEIIQQNNIEYFQQSDATGRVGFVPKELAEAIMAKYTFRTRRDSDEIYIYTNGVYKPHGATYIREECAQELQEKYRRNYADEVTDYIRATTYTEFQPPPLHLINVENGILNIKTKQLEKHSPNHLFLHKIPVEYCQDSSCPKILEFLDQVTIDKNEKHILLDYIAYCLYRNYIFHKALLLIGVGENGKSVFLNLVQAFLGKENISNRSIQELASDRFATADLYGKLANICGDLSNKAINNTGIFKMLVGNDPITAQKKFIGAFKFQNYAKLMFSTNQPPEPKHDQSHAFFRRWLLITFPNIFKGEKADPNILKKITTPEELSGLLNLSIDNLQALLLNGGFNETQTTEQVRNNYMRKANPIQAFAEDCLTEDFDAVIPKKELYNKYTQYCNQNNHSPEGKTKFENEFRKIGITTLQEKQTRVAGRNLWCWTGISFNTQLVPNVPKKQGNLIGKSLRLEKKREEKCQKNGTFGTSKSKHDVIDEAFPAHDGKFPVCCFCHKKIGDDEYLEVSDGRPCHAVCKERFVEGRKT